MVAVMSWRDRLRPGSFRGVPFYTLSSDAEGGRRGVVFEMPARDTPITQDLGKAAARFTVEAFVIGADYDIAKRNLIDALEKGGPGPLVHRYFGQFQAEVEPGKNYRVVESQDEGGMARFSISFLRVGDLAKVTAKPNTQARVKLSAAKARAASIAAFDASFNPRGPEFIRDGVIGRLESAIASVDDINDRVARAIGTVNTVNAQISRLGNTIAQVVATPARIAEMAPGMFGVVDSVTGSIGAIGNALRRTLEAVSSNPFAAEREEAQKVARALSASLSRSRLIGSADPVIASTTVRGAQAAKNQAAVRRLTRQAFAIGASEAAAQIAYDSHPAALAMRDQVADALDALGHDSEDDGVFAALADLRADIADHLTRAAGELPRLRTVPVPVTLPALYLAHRYHRDAGMESEILARNVIPHPGLVPGGTTVDILNV